MRFVFIDMHRTRQSRRFKRTTRANEAHTKAANLLPRRRQTKNGRGISPTTPACVHDSGRVLILAATVHGGRWFASWCGRMYQSWQVGNGLSLPDQSPSKILNGVLFIIFGQLFPVDKIALEAERYGGCPAASVVRRPSDSGGNGVTEVGERAFRCHTSGDCIVFWSYRPIFSASGTSSSNFHGSIFGATEQAVLKI